MLGQLDRRGGLIPPDVLLGRLAPPSRPAAEFAESGPIPYHGAVPMPIIKDVLAKSALNPSKIHDYCLNPYTGCEVNCVYCYAALFMRRYSGHAEPWGGFVDVKVNAPELLRRQLPRARRGMVWISSVCDPYQPIEKTRGLTRRCLEELLQWQMPVQIQTKSVLALRDIDLFPLFRDISVGFTIATDSDETARLFEPGASSVGDRVDALAELRGRGVRTFAFAGPLLPGDPERLAGLLAGRADRVLIDRLNYAPAIKAFYARHGLGAFLKEEFFLVQRDRLAAALRRRGTEVEVVF
jgi:DNA repair photolyase